MTEDEIDILLVEDNPDDAAMCMHVLKKSKITKRVVHVEDGKKAIDFLFARDDFAIRNSDNKPKLILLDLKMPKVNGIEVLQQIKSNEQTKTIPVVILTSSKEDSDISQCLKLGANSYVVKPVAFKDYTKAVTELVHYWLLMNRRSG